MKRQGVLFIIACLAILLGSCRPVGLAQARKGLYPALAKLPEPEGFTIVTIIRSAGAPDWARRPCYIADALVAIGTDVPREEALDKYVQALQAQGWVTQQVAVPSPLSRELIRGEYERISLDVLEGPGWIIGSDERYQQYKDQYAGFVYLLQGYYLPDRVTCLGD